MRCSCTSRDGSSSDDPRRAPHPVPRTHARPRRARDGVPAAGDLLPRVRVDLRGHGRRRHPHPPGRGRHDRRRRHASSHRRARGRRRGHQGRGSGRRSGTRPPRQGRRGPRHPAGPPRRPRGRPAPHRASVRSDARGCGLHARRPRAARLRAGAPRRGAGRGHRRARRALPRAERRAAQAPRGGPLGASRARAAGAARSVRRRLRAPGRRRAEAQHQPHRLLRGGGGDPVRAVLGRARCHRPARRSRRRHRRSRARRPGGHPRARRRALLLPRAAGLRADPDHLPGRVAAARRGPAGAHRRLGRDDLRGVGLGGGAIALARRGLLEPSSGADDLERRDPDLVGGRRLDGAALLHAAADAGPRLVHPQHVGPRGLHGRVLER